MKTFIKIAALAVFLASLVEGRVGNTELLRQLLRERYGDLEEPAARRNSELRNLPDDMASVYDVAGERGYPKSYNRDSMYKRLPENSPDDEPGQFDTDGENSELCEILNKLKGTKSSLLAVVLDIEKSISGDSEERSIAQIPRSPEQDDCSLDKIRKNVDELEKATKQIVAILKMVKQHDEDTGLTQEVAEITSIESDDTVEITTLESDETPITEATAAGTEDAERQLAKKLLVRELYEMLKKGNKGGQ